MLSNNKSDLEKQVYITGDVHSGGRPLSPAEGDQWQESFGDAQAEPESLVLDNS